jgi:hypothetical protein
MKLDSLKDLRGGGGGGGVWEEGYNGGYFLSSRFFHAGDGKYEFHDAIVDIFILKGFYDVDVVASYEVEDLDVDLAVLEG